VVSLWLAILIPGVYVVAAGPVYDGIGHLSFLYPPFVALAAATAAALWNEASPSALSAGRILVACMAGAMIGPIAFSVRCHPNEGMYSSELFGGPSGAFGRYEMDYRASSVRQAVRWIHDNGRSSCRPMLRISAESVEHVAVPESLRFDDTLVVADSRRACFVIEPVRRDPRSIAAGMSDVIHAVAIDGAPVCWILRGGGKG
jgi:hypothetical protein